MGETVLPVAQPYQISNVATIIAYGFAVNIIDPSLIGLPTNLYSRSGHGVDEDGLGMLIDSSSDHEIDTKHFVQLDLADLIKKQSLKCGPPTITIGSIQKDEGFIVYGSNKLGFLGVPIYTFIDVTGSTEVKTISIPSFETDFTNILLYGLEPYRYISVRASGGNVIINNIVFSYCNCSC